MDGSIFGGLLVDREIQTHYSDLSNGELTARLATTPEIWRDAWTVRHAAYASQGFIEPSASGMFIDECDFSPSSRVIVVYRGGMPVGTARVCLYAPGSGVPGSDSLPAMQVFPDEIARVFKEIHEDENRIRAVEVMRFSTHPEVGNDRELVYALYLMAGYVILNFNANAVVCGIRKHHIPFYRRLGCHQITEPRPYPKLKFLTALMARVEKTNWELQQAMPILHPVSRTDDIYSDLIAGNPVQVFRGERTADSVGRILSRRPSLTPVETAPARMTSAGAEFQLAA